jgi:hypothetical protein
VAEDNIANAQLFLSMAACWKRVCHYCSQLKPQILRVEVNFELRYLCVECLVAQELKRVTKNPGNSKIELQSQTTFPILEVVPKLPREPSHFPSTLTGQEENSEVKELVAYLKEHHEFPLRYIRQFLLDDATVDSHYLLLFDREHGGDKQKYATCHFFPEFIKKLSFSCPYKDAPGHPAQEYVGHIRAYHHALTCIHRPFPCPYCQENISLALGWGAGITAHMAQCKFAPCPCSSCAMDDSKTTAFQRRWHRLLRWPLEKNGPTLLQTLDDFSDVIKQDKAPLLAMPDGVMEEEKERFLSFLSQFSESALGMRRILNASACSASSSGV